MGEMVNFMVFITIKNKLRAFKKMFLETIALLKKCIIVSNVSYLDFAVKKLYYFIIHFTFYLK